LRDNTVIELREQDPQIPAPVATAKSIGGKFLLKGKLPASNLFYLTYQGTEQKLFVFLEPAVMTLTAHRDSLSSGVLKGSASHLAFSEFNNVFSPLYGRLGQLSQQLQTGADADGSLRRQYDAALAETQAKADEYIGRNASSVVAPFAILVVSQLSQDPVLLERRFEMLSPAAKGSLYGKMVAQSVADAKVGSIGSEALDFTQNDPDGKPVKLSSFRGKYVLLDFWASWCVPCRQENPGLKALYARYKDKGFEIIGISVDEDGRRWRRAIVEDALPWIHVSDLKRESSLANLFGVQPIPDNFLIDPDGRIVVKGLHGKALEEALASRLGK